MLVGGFDGKLFIILYHDGDVAVVIIVLSFVITVFSYGSC